LKGALVDSPHHVVAIKDSLSSAGLPAIAWPERLDQWLLWILGASLSLFLAAKGIQWVRDRERRDLLTTLSDDNHALLILLLHLATYLTKNPALPEPGLTVLEFHLRACDSHRERLPLLKDQDLRHKVIDWYGSLTQIPTEAKALRQVDELLHAPPNGLPYMIPFKQALAGLRTTLTASYTAGVEVQRLLAKERLGWRFKFWKAPKDPSVATPPWPPMPKRGFYGQT